MSASGFISRSHGAIAPFTLSRPSTVAEAASRLGGGAVAHAGGIDVVRRLREGEPIEELVRLVDLEELHVIEVAGDRLRIGAAVTHHRIETDPAVVQHRPDLSEAWCTVGNVRIRRTGTVGGNLMMFDKDYDAAPVLAAAGAALVYADGSRHDVVGRPRDGLLVRIDVPITGRALRFDRRLKPALSVATGDRVAVGCAYPDVVVVDQAADIPEPLDDAFASAAYRRRMIEALARR